MAEKIFTSSEKETEELGRRLGHGLKKGDVVALYGELGAGKTAFTRGIAKGLGESEGRAVRSPSFTLINVYGGGRCPLYHIDLYRLSGGADVLELGLEEYVYGDGVCVIEWAERAEEMLPPAAVKVRFENRGGDGRGIEFDKSGGVLK